MVSLTAKILALLLAGISVSKSYVDFKARKDSLQIFIFWLMTWIAVVIVALFPRIIDVLIEQFGGGETGLGTFFGMALVFVLFVVYRIYIKLERIEQTVIKTVQDIALREEWKSRK
jgi:hypothetical protein